MSKRLRLGATGMAWRAVQRSLAGLLTLAAAAALQGGCAAQDDEFFTFAPSVALASAPNHDVATAITTFGDKLSAMGLPRLAATLLEDCRVQIAWTEIHVGAGFMDGTLGPEASVLMELCGPSVVYAGLGEDRLKLVGTVAPQTDVLGDQRFLLGIPADGVWYMEVPLRRTATPYHKHIHKHILRALRDAGRGPEGIHIDSESMDGSDIHCLQIKEAGQVRSLVVVNPWVRNLYGEQKPLYPWGARLLAVSELCRYAWAGMLVHYVQELPER